jgi:hypothetical protein
MKISYRNQAILKMLSTGTMGPVAIHSQDKNELTDELLGEFGKLWKINATSFNENVKILSLPFAEAVIQSAEKLTTGDLIERAFIENNCGTLIMNDRTICYTFERINEKSTVLTYYLFQKSPTEIPELKCFIYSEFDEHDFSANTQSYISKSGIYKNDVSLSIEMYIKMLIATLNFIKYADVEVKLLPANKIVKDIRCKYVNETNSNIQYLNSTWFTTLIKSDAFKVRGHFRLQPKKKDGEWTKELKWINEFEKTGYTSLAKKTID